MDCCQGRDVDGGTVDEGGYGRGMGTVGMEYGRCGKGTRADRIVYCIQYARQCKRSLVDRKR